MYKRFTVFSNLSKLLVVLHIFGFYEISTPVMATMLTIPNKDYVIIFNIPQTVYIRYTTFWNFSKLLFVLHILAFTKFQLRWCAPFQLLWTLFKSSFLPLRSLCKSDLQWFQIFRNCSLFRHIWLLRNFYSGDAHYANNGKHSLNHHFQHTAHSVYKIYSVFKLFEIAVCLHILAFTKFLLRWWPPCSL